MFFKLYRYSILQTMRQKLTIFWSLLFPIIMGTLFRVSFGDFMNETVVFHQIPVAYVTEEGQFDAFQAVLESLEEEEELVKAVGKVAKYEAADHLRALHVVEQLTHEVAKKDCQRGGEQRSQQKAADTREPPMGGKEDRDLRRHRADDNTKVESQPRKNRDNQREHKEAVACNTGEQLAHNKVHRLPGSNGAANTEEYEQDDNLVFEQERGNFVFSHGSHLQSGPAHR